MKSIRAALRQVVGLFVDDGSLALEIVAVVVLAGIFATVFPEVSLAAGGILLIGCLAALFGNVATAGRR